MFINNKFTTSVSSNGGGIFRACAFDIQRNLFIDNFGTQGVIYFAQGGNGGSSSLTLKNNVFLNNGVGSTRSMEGNALFVYRDFSISAN